MTCHHTFADVHLPVEDRIPLKVVALKEKSAVARLLEQSASLSRAHLGERATSRWAFSSQFRIALTAVVVAW